MSEPRTGAPVVRGLPTRGTDLKEFFHTSVILAIAAAAGCNARRIRHRGDQQRGCRERDPIADVARLRRRQEPAEVTSQAPGRDPLSDSHRKSLRGATRGG